VIWFVYRFLFTFFNVQSPGHRARLRLETAGATTLAAMIVALVTGSAQR